MLKKTHFSTLLISLFLPQFCFSDQTAQEIIIPGYNPSAPASSSVMKANMKAVAAAPVKSVEKLATLGDMDDLIKTVDLSDWSVLSNYMWTCTPSNFNLPPPNAKNKLKIEFDALVQANKTPTLSQAKDLTKKLTQPVNYRIMGLYGYACHLTTIYPSTKKEPQQFFNCFLSIRDARYLSQLTSKVAVKKGTSDLVPDDTLAAITNLMTTHCKICHAGMQEFYRGCLSQ